MKNLTFGFNITFFLQSTSFFNRVFLSFQTDAFLILQNMAYKSYNSLLDQILDLCAQQAWIIQHLEKNQRCTTIYRPVVELRNGGTCDAQICSCMLEPSGLWVWLKCFNNQARTQTMVCLTWSKYCFISSQPLAFGTWKQKKRKKAFCYGLDL